MTEANSINRLAVMQPTYLPWLGYFSLIKDSDLFIYLDDAKFEKSSWHSRNRVLVNKAATYITVQTTGSRYNLINETPLGQPKWKKVHSRMLGQTYAKSPYGKEILPQLVEFISHYEGEFLADLNIDLIDFFCDFLGIETKRVRSSQLNIDGKRSERLIKFCEHFNIREYISPVGSKEYIEEEEHFKNSIYPVLYQENGDITYPQFNNRDNFISHLSIIDVICNQGKEGTLKLLEKFSYK